jgi:hypothetical protein
MTCTVFETGTLVGGLFSGSLSFAVSGGGFCGGVFGGGLFLCAFRFSAIGVGFLRGDFFGSLNGFLLGGWCLGLGLYRLERVCDQLGAGNRQSADEADTEAWETVRTVDVGWVLPLH